MPREARRGDAAEEQSRHVGGQGSGTASGKGACLACRRPGFNPQPLAGSSEPCQEQALNTAGCSPQTNKNTLRACAYDAKEEPGRATALPALCPPALSTVSSSLALRWIPATVPGLLGSCLVPEQRERSSPSPRVSPAGLGAGEAEAGGTECGLQPASLVTFGQ